MSKCPYSGYKAFSKCPVADVKALAKCPAIATVVKVHRPSLLQLGSPAV